MTFFDKLVKDKVIDKDDSIYIKKFISNLDDENEIAFVVDYYYTFIKKFKGESCKCSCEESVDVLNDSIELEKELSIDCTIEEYAGFNFQDYLQDILGAVESRKYKDLIAITQEQIDAGLFTENEIDQLKFVLKKGYKEGSSMLTIAKEFESKVNIKDRLKLDEDGHIVNNAAGEPVLQMNSKYRAMMITRTEIIATSNQGLLNNFKKNGIEQVKWSAALSERTCDFCNSQNGTLLDIDDAQEQIPAHPNCRCFTDPKIPIYTSQGWKKIGNIKVGDLVLSHRGKFKRVNNLIRTPKYKGEIITVEIKHSKWKNSNKTHRLSTTPEHPYLTERGWVNANQLTKNDKLIIMGEKCLECGTVFPVFKREVNRTEDRFCSQICSNRYKANEQYKDEQQHIIRSVKATEQMNREYLNGTRDKYEITKKANETVRKIGQPKLIGKPSWNANKKCPSLSKACKGTRWNSLERINNYTQEELKSIITKQKEKRMSTLRENNFISKPQREMYATILENCAEAELEYPLKTKEGIKFIDVAIPSKKIAFEFDGKHWHSEKEIDIIKTQKRAQAIMNEGWIVVSFNEDTISQITEELQRILKNHSNEYVFSSVNINNIKTWKVKRAKMLYNFSVEDDESYVAKGFVTHNCTWLSNVSLD